MEVIRASCFFSAGGEVEEIIKSRRGEGMGSG